MEIIDRKEAIRYAITHGQTGDVIVLAGKGHEDYQEIEGVKHPMDERVLIAEILTELEEEQKKLSRGNGLFADIIVDIKIMKKAGIGSFNIEFRSG